MYKSVRAFFLTPFRASLTVEAALVLPVFLFFMVAAVQYGVVMETAVRFGTALSETGQSMATAAYLSKYGGDTDGIGDLAGTVLSTACAHRKVMAKAGSTSAVKNANMALSGFLKEDDMIDLVLTYQIRSPVKTVSLPGRFFVQRASVRAWTGRMLPGEAGNTEGEDAGQDYVYIAENGRVYHDDPDCTHLRLSVRAVDIEALSTLRNNSGSIYHKCERCTGSLPGSTVYITGEGNRYHSSLGCSGLKRTVSEVHRDEAGDLRACSKCGKN